MNESLFNLVTSDNIVAYWIEKNVNEQPMFGETLFPLQREVGIKLDWIKGANNQPVALRLSAYDSKAIRRDREGIEQYTTKMPFFKESVYIDEDMRQQLNNLLQTNNDALIKRLVGKIFEDQIKLIQASLVSLERMRMELLSNGTITLASNGQAYDYDFGVPEDQKATVAKSWSDPSADIIKDINDIKTKMLAKGVRITRAVCNSSVLEDFAKNESIVKQIYVLAQGAISNVGVSRAQAFVEQETGIKFFAYDNVYVNEEGAAVKYIADDTVTFIPEGTLGNTHLGTTPEESDLMNGVNGDASVTLTNGGIAVTTFATVDPVNVTTKISMVAMPSFERANEIYILDTVA